MLNNINFRKIQYSELLKTEKFIVSKGQSLSFFQFELPKKLSYYVNLYPNYFNII